jgi:hypothetical protein
MSDVQQRRPVIETNVVDAIAAAYEANLGSPRERHHVTERLHVLRFDTGARDDIATYVTLGLGGIVVRQEAGDVRQELMFECYQQFAGYAWASVLTFVAGRVALDGSAVAAFEVIDLDPTLRTVTGFDALLCYTPIYHSPALQMIARTDPPTVVVWLLPLYRSEAAMARRAGWEPLVSLFEASQPDFHDLKRKPVA